MVQKHLTGVSDYEAPRIDVAEISVEQGFAGSGFGEDGRAGDDLSAEDYYPF